jgi:uncharacterized protein (DUF2235 family)
MNPRHRLIVCLDGTWNRQDSSTNVLHHFNLIHEGSVPGTDIEQKKYYHPGVGTGVLDSITGGGFGIGLEGNVRDAYNWLIGHFCDHDETHAADEIYIFGFSRGAYTARSLVGFISQRGLLRRGAPLTVEQLWSDYCVLGRQKEQRKSLWEKFLPEASEVRSYTTLLTASHQGGKLEAAEHLLLQWSRRVPIRYLGVYDTVGAIGWDALAIPGLTSKLAFHNNVRPTTLIKSCRHALAIDENRSSFNHTLFIAYLSEDSDESERLAGQGKHSIKEEYDKWCERIQQCWFVGAHSNIGGGYPNNRLAQAPLEWLTEGAIKCGLKADAPSPPQPQTVPESLTPETYPATDSYAQFASPLWETLIRNKRNYRVLDPDAELRARRNDSDGGFALETINESLHQSVTKYWKDSGKPIPPNLECYLKRKKNDLPEGSLPAQHSWIRDHWLLYAALVIWTVAAVFGVYALNSIGGFTPKGLPLYLAYAIAIFLPVIDWLESRVTFGYAVGTGGPRARAFLDSVYWIRTLGFVLFAFGTAYAACVFVAAGLDHKWPISLEFLANYWAVPFLAAAPALFLTKLKSKYAWGALVLGPAGVAALSGFLFAVGFTIRSLLPALDVDQFWGKTDQLSMPGLLLLLQLFAIYFWRSFIWVGEPQRRANLGTIVSLQLCPTPAKVVACVDRWRARLSYTAVPDISPMAPPAVTLRRILREVLWRDIIGFIPVYTMFLLVGLKFATMVSYANWAALMTWIPWASSLAPWVHSRTAPLADIWWVLPALAAVTDYIEDFCHLRYLKLFERDPGKNQPSTILTLFSFTATLIKDLAFVASGIICTLAILAGTSGVFSASQMTDWRAKISVVLTALGLASVLLLVIAYIAGRIRKRRHPSA